MRVRDSHRARLVIRIRPRLLVRRPWSGDGLTCHLEIVDQLRPGPHRGALAGLRRVLDELVEPWIALALAVSFDPHEHSPRTKGRSAHRMPRDQLPFTGSFPGNSRRRKVRPRP